MPNRMLRDITDSELINKLSAHAEVLFYRLMMKADDYGSFHANVKLVKSNCFPLKTDTIRDADLSRWLHELQTSGVIVIYTVAGKKYLRINNFGQRLRNKNNKYPSPNELEEKLTASCDHSPHLAATRRNSRPEVEVEVEEEEEEEVEVPKLITDPFFEMFRRVAGSHISNDELIQEIGKFKNKYPNQHPNHSGALINTWVANIGKTFTAGKRRVVV